MSLEAVPCDIADANAFVAQHHRHNRPVTVARFAIAAAKDGKVVGVSIVGNPVARRERESILEIAKYARECHPGEADGDYVGRMLEDSDERMACALLRLDRVSSKGDDK